MDFSGLILRIKERMHKDRYAVLIVAIGLGLMLLPEFSGTHPAPAPEPAQQLSRREDLEQRLAEILGRIDGAGKVCVLLTEKTGSEIQFQTDSREEWDSVRQSEQHDTVLTDRSGGIQQGLIRRQDPPVYLGALVVCQGAGQPRVQLAVLRAVACVTGLRSDQIQVVKMQ